MPTNTFEAYSLVQPHAATRESSKKVLSSWLLLIAVVLWLIRGESASASCIVDPMAKITGYVLPKYRYSCVS